MIYVMSDIHGNARRFESVMKQIHLQPDDTLYVLGDVIDRYPDGIKILRKLMKLPNAEMLLGNHEYMMLNALDTPYNHDDPSEEFNHEGEVRLWYNNGGYATHTYLKHIRKEIRAEIFDYLRKLPLNIDIEVNGVKYKLIHGAPTERYDDYKYRYDDVTEFAVWKHWNPGDPESKGCVLIFGHTPTLEFQYENPLKIWYAPSKRRIGIDCGSGFPVMENPKRHRRNGRLACLRLDDMREFYSEENEWNGDDENEP